MLLALPFLAALVVLLAGGSGHEAKPPGGDRAYLAAMLRLCSSAEQTAAGDPPLPPHFPGLDTYVNTRLLRARAFRARLAAIRPPSADARLHGRLAAATVDEVTTLERLRPAVSAHDQAATTSLIQHFQAVNTERDRVAAWLGLPDCLRVQGADPRLAYPPVSSHNLARALQGVCADSQARLDFGDQLIDAFPASKQSRSQARQRLRRQVDRRLYALVRRVSTQRVRLRTIRRLGLAWCSQEPS